MDPFKQLIRTLLEDEGYWVLQDYLVDLNKEDKKRLGSPSIGRPEIDLIAYRGGREELLAVEVKAFLDSPGINHKELCVSYGSMQGRYELFTVEKYRGIVMQRLREKLAGVGAIPETAAPTLCLATGNVQEGSLAPLKEHFAENQWRLITPADVADKLRTLATAKYSSDPMVLAAKVLLKVSA